MVHFELRKRYSRMFAKHRIDRPAHLLIGQTLNCVQEVLIVGHFVHTHHATGGSVNSQNTIGTINGYHRCISASKHRFVDTAKVRDINLGHDVFSSRNGWCGLTPAHIPKHLCGGRLKGALWQRKSNGTSQALINFPLFVYELECGLCGTRCLGFTEKEITVRMA